MCLRWVWKIWDIGERKGTTQRRSECTEIVSVIHSKMGHPNYCWSAIFQRNLMVFKPVPARCGVSCEIGRRERSSCSPLHATPYHSIGNPFRFQRRHSTTYCRTKRKSPATWDSIRSQGKWALAHLFQCVRGIFLRYDMYDIYYPKTGGVIVSCNVREFHEPCVFDSLT